MLDIKRIKQLLADYIYKYDDGVIRIENLDGWEIKDELAEEIKMAHFINHLSFILFLENSQSRDAASFRREQDKYLERALKILDVQNAQKSVQDSNDKVLSALFAKSGYSEVEVQKDTPLLNMFIKNEQDFYKAYLNAYFKRENKALLNLDFKITAIPDTDMAVVSISKYLAPLQMTEEERKIKAETLKIREYIANYHIVTDEGKKRLLSNNFGEYIDDLLEAYEQAESVYKEAEELRENMIKMGLGQDSIDMYIDAVLQGRMQKQKAKAAESQRKNNPETPLSSPTEDTPKPEEGNSADTSEEEKKSAEAPSQDNTTEPAPASNTNEHNGFITLEEIKYNVNNFMVKDGQVFAKNGIEVTNQTQIDRIKTSIMLYCEARDLKNIVVNLYEQKEREASFYFKVIMKKYAVNGEVNSYGINKVVNGLLNSNGHFEDQYVPFLEDKYAILKGTKKSYFESYLRLKFQEKGLYLETLDVKFENIENNYIKVCVDMKLVPLKDREKDGELALNKPPKDLGTGEEKTSFNNIANPFGADHVTKTPEPPKDLKTPKEGEKSQEGEPAKNEGPETQGHKNARKVEKRRKCTAKEKISNTLFIIGALFFGERLNGRSESYCELVQQIGYLRYESHKGNIEITNEHIQNLREKMAKSSDLTDKEKKRVEKRINKLAKKVKESSKKNESKSSEPKPSEPEPKPGEPKAPETEPPKGEPERNTPSQEGTPNEPTNPTSNITPARTINEIIESLVDKDPLAVTDEEWNSMDDLQRQAVVKIKIHEAQITGDEKAINYWQDIYNKLVSEENLSNDESKGRK